MSRGENIISSNQSQDGDHPSNINQVQVTCKFTTKLPKKFAVPSQLLTIPGETTRYGLSQILNHLLEFEQPYPFDFIISNQLLRLQLAQHLQQHEISVEQVVEIEYTSLLAPPQFQKSQVAGDWISCIDTQSYYHINKRIDHENTPINFSDLVACGSYDGYIRFYGPNMDSIGAFMCHDHGVSQVQLIQQSETQIGENKCYVVSSGKDGIFNISGYEIINSQKKIEIASLEHQVTLVGHVSSVNCFDIASTSSSIFSGDTEGGLYTFPSIEKCVEDESDDINAQQTNKRQKANNKLQGGNKFQARSIAAAARIDAHTQQISDLCAIGKTLYSSSWDHSIKQWDQNNLKYRQTLNTNKVVLCLDIHPSQPEVVVFGSGDGVLRAWDVRQHQRGESSSIQIKGKHSSWISTVNFAPTSSNHLVTGSYDNSVRIWDLRTVVPIATMNKHSDHVLSVKWSDNNNIYSGGKDSCLVEYTFDYIPDNQI